MNQVLSHLRSLLPRTSDLRQVKRHWRADIPAGLTVGVVALPLALAFGVSSGVGAAAGLVTAIIAGLTAAIFGGSNVQVSGPTGAMVVIIAPLVAQHGVGALPLLSVMAGILVFAGAIAGIGRAISLIPWPVIEGFTLGIAITIFLQQVPAAFGVEAVPGLNSLQAAFRAAFQAPWPDAAITLSFTAGAVVLLLLLERYAPKIPASLIVVALATILIWITKPGVDLIGEVPSSLPMPTAPAATPELMMALLPGAVAVALLAGIESLLSARIAAGMVPGGTYEPDRELFGQGLASIASGLFGGMPATGAIARTAVNVRSGGRSRLSSIIHALLLLVIVYAASGVVAFIPLFSLSAVLMVTTFRMVSGRTIRQIMGSTKSDAFTFVITAGITVALDLIWAIVAGMVVAGTLVLRRLASRSGVYRENRTSDPRIAVFRVDGSMFFGVADRLQSEIPRLTGVDVVILRLSRIGVMDATGAKALSDVVEALRSQNKQVIVKGLPGQYRPLVDRMGLESAVGDTDLIVDNWDQAIAMAKELSAEAALAETARTEAARIEAAKLEAARAKSAQAEAAQEEADRLEIARAEAAGETPLVLAKPAKTKVKKAKKTKSRSSKTQSKKTQSKKAKGTKAAAKKDSQKKDTIRENGVKPAETKSAAPDRSKTQPE